VPSFSQQLWLVPYQQVHLLVDQQGAQRHVDVVLILVLIRYPT
jgi:hypothetical protein